MYPTVSRFVAIRPAPGVRMLRFLGVAVLALISACGGGSGVETARPSTGSPGLAKLVFPSTSCKTSQPTLTVRGIVEELGAVEGVRVDGIDATSTDDWQTWTAEIPLAAGVNDLIVASLATGTSTYVPTDQVQAERIDAFPMAAHDVVYSPVDETMYVLGERGELVAQLSDGTRRLLGDHPVATHLDVDVLDGRIFARLGAGEIRIGQISVRDGSITTVARDGDGQGPNLPRDYLIGFAIHPFLNAAVLVYRGATTFDMWLVDLDTGVRTNVGAIADRSNRSFSGIATSQMDSNVVLLGSSSGSAPHLFDCDPDTAVVVERTADLGIQQSSSRISVRSVTAGQYAAVFADRSTSSDLYLLDHRASVAQEIANPDASTNLTASRKHGPFFGLDAGELFTHSERFPDVIRVDLGNGSRDIVHSVSHRSGPLSRPGAIAYQGRTVYVGDRTLFPSTSRPVSHSVQSLSLVGDEMTVVASNDRIELQSALDGPEFRDVLDIASTPSGISFWAITRNSSSLNEEVFEIDGASRSIWSQPMFQNPSFLNRPMGMCAGPNDSVFLNKVHRAERIDRATGASSVVNGTTIGSTGDLTYDLAYDEANDSILLLQPFDVRVVSLATGDSSVLYSVASGMPPLEFILFDPAANQIYVVSNGGAQDPTIRLVDPATGDAQIVVDGSTHELFPERVHHIDMDPDGDVAYFTDNEWTMAIYSADLVTGECVLIAR